MNMQLLGFIIVGGVFAFGLLLLASFTLRDDFVKGKIPKPPKQIKKKKL